MLSPGLVCRKSLSTTARFHTSSSNLPSITGGLSERGMTIGLAFSGGMTARFTLSDAPPALGFGEGEAEVAWAAADVQKAPSKHASQSSCFTIIVIFQPLSDLTCRL